jgi:hypothetical protein
MSNTNTNINDFDVLNTQNELNDLIDRKDVLIQSIGVSQPSKLQMSDLQTIYAQQLSLYNSIQNESSPISQEDLIKNIQMMSEDTEERISELQSSDNNKIRQAKINRYYSDKYEAQVKLLKIIITMLVPIALLSFLYNSDYILEDAFNVLVIVILIIGGIFFIRQFVDIIRRNNQNFQEIDWKFREPKKEVKKIN